MRQKPMKAHPHTQAGGNPPEQDGDHQRRPIEYKECGHCADVKKDHKYGGIPLNTLASLVSHRFVAHSTLLVFAQ
jgi:hypothetical protein